MFFCPLETKTVPLLMACIVPRTSLLPWAEGQYLLPRYWYGAGLTPPPGENRIFFSSVEMSPDNWSCVHPESFYIVSTAWGGLCSCGPWQETFPILSTANKIWVAVSSSCENAWGCQPIQDVVFSLAVAGGGMKYLCGGIPGPWKPHRNVSLPAVTVLGAAQGLLHHRPGLLQAEEAQGEGSGVIKSISIMSLIAVLKYSWK